MPLMNFAFPASRRKRSIDELILRYILYLALERAYALKWQSAV